MIPTQHEPVPLTRRGVVARLFAMATTQAMIAGCTGGARHADPVDPERAREALRTTLEAWKKGESVAALKSGSPPIVAQDFDWMAGYRLVTFEVDGAGKDDDANLRIPVTLTLRSAQGKEIRKAVTYVVGTSPSITVFRDFQ